MVLHGVYRSHGHLSLPDLRETYRLAPLVKTPAKNKVRLEFVIRTVIIIFKQGAISQKVVFRTAL